MEFEIVNKYCEVTVVATKNSKTRELERRLRRTECKLAQLERDAGRCTHNCG